MPRPMLTRRNLLAWGLGTAGAVAVVGLPMAGANESTTTLWKLDPNWGTPRKTSTGATRTRCRGRACHNAAPNRYFLSEEDALAGRLHPCCLAQPVKVHAEVEKTVLLEYLGDSGLLDIRTAALPSSITKALKDATDVAGLSNSNTFSSDAGSSGGSSGGAGSDGDAPDSLAFTGGDAAVIAAVGMGAVAVGSATVVAARRRHAAAAVAETDTAVAPTADGHDDD